jgi:hypothetical protein
MRAGRLLMLALLCDTACSEPPYNDVAPSRSEVADAASTDGAFGGEPVVTALLFRDLRVASVSGGLSAGFDLDGLVSTVTDESCGGADFTGPEGTPGIDNGVGTIWADFYDVLGASLESLFRDGVSRGGDIPALLLGNDARWASARLDGAAVDFDGLLAGYQTFDLLSSGEPVVVEQRADTLEVAPWDTVVVVPAFGPPLTLSVTGLRLSLHRDEDGVWRGVAGGAFEADAVPEVLGTIPALASGETLTAAVARAADIPDATNACRRISFAATVEAVEGFVVPPSAL